MKDVKLKVKNVLFKTVHKKLFESIKHIVYKVKNEKLANIFHRVNFNTNICLEQRCTKTSLIFLCAFSDSVAC